MEDSEGSYYSNDEEYFLDVCRTGDLQELQEFVQSQKETSFDWTCFTNSHDNFLHMLAANNLSEVFDFLFPIVAAKVGSQVQVAVNKQNSTGNTPLHYAVITGSKEMVGKLIAIKADPNIKNEAGRTPFAEAQQFDKEEIAEMLAPITQNNLEELKKDLELLNVCNEDSSQDEEEDEENNGCQEEKEIKEEKTEPKQEREGQGQPNKDP